MEQSQILGGNPYLGRVFVFRNTLVSYFQTFFRIRAQGIDLAIVCGAEAFAPLSIPLLLRPKWSIGLSADPSCKLSFTKRIPIDPSEGLSHGYQKIAESMGVKIQDRRLFIVKKGKDNRRMQEEFDRVGIAGKDRLMGIGLGYDGTGQLSKSAYSLLLQKFLQKRDTAVLLFGPPGSQERMHGIRDAMDHPPPVIVAGLDEAFAVMERLDCLFTEDPFLFLVASVLKKNGIFLEAREDIKGIGAYQSEGMRLIKPPETGDRAEILAQAILTSFEGEKNG